MGRPMDMAAFSISTRLRRRLLALHWEDADVRVLPGGTSFRVELRLPAKRGDRGVADA
jgi:hypothetical protein